MKAWIDFLNPSTLCRSEDIKPSVILLLGALVPTLHRYFGSMEFARRSLNMTSESSAAAYMFVTAGLLLGILPLLVVRLIFHEPLQSFGLGLGRWREGLILAGVLFVVIAPTLLLPSSQTAEMRAFYPFDKGAGGSPFAFLRLELLRGVFFYTAWEFFFRGFMLFGLRPCLGDWLAVCVQTIPSCLWHIGLPTGEIFASIAAGILFGVLALKTKSIWWVCLLHFLIGFGTDGLIVLTS